MNPEGATVRLRVALVPKVTRAGAGAGFLAAGLLFAGMNTGNNLFHLLFCVIAAAALVNAVLARRVLRRTAVVLRIAPRGEAGRPLRLELDVTGGTGRLPLPALAWRIETDAGEAGRRIIPPAPPRGVARGTARVVPARRGRLRVARALYGTAFPFGLIEARASLTPEGVAALVRPRPRFGAETARRSGSTERAATDEGRSQGSDPADARHHRPEDDARSIDWKATARSGRLITRERRGAPDPIAVVTVDLSHEGERFEHEVSCAAAAVLAFMQRGVAVGLDAGPFSQPARTGAAHHAALLDALALVVPSAKKGPAPASALPTRQVRR